MHHDKQHKISTGTTLLRRAKQIPNTIENQVIETKHVVDTLQANSYPPKLIADIQKRLKKQANPSEVPLPEVLLREFF